MHSRHYHTIFLCYMICIDLYMFVCTCLVARIEEYVQEPQYKDLQNQEFEVFEQQPLQHQGKCP